MHASFDLWLARRAKFEIATNHCKNNKHKQTKTNSFGNFYHLHFLVTKNIEPVFDEQIQQSL